MAFTLPPYTTREIVKAATDTKLSARSDDQVDRAIESASRSVEGTLQRTFYPLQTTRYFDWPGPDGTGWELWLGEHGLISASTVTAGGDTIVSADYFLEPRNEGPPFESVQIDLGSNASFQSGDTWQRAIAITGTWGYTLDSMPGGALAEALDSSETGVDITNSAAIGVGSVVFCESEWMIVTGKTMVDTTVNTGSSLTASVGDQDIAVSDGTVFTVGETLLVEAERLLIVDIAGNTLYVKRAHDGTTLAAHNSGVDIYAPRTLTVTRGALGTSAAGHSTSTALTVWQPPGLVAEFCVAVALTTLGQRQAGYARVVGSGDNQREASGRGLAQIRMDALATYGRVRVGAV